MVLNIIVCMKRTPDTATKIAVKDGQIDPACLDTWIINPYDEYAIEESLQLKDKVGGGKVTLVSVGPPEAQETIRKGLAMGCDEAVHLVDDAFVGLDPMGAAKVLAAAIQKVGNFDLVYTGWKGVDEDHGQTGIYLAEFLDMPHVSMVVKINEVGDAEAEVEREVEGGHELVHTSLPAVFTAQKGDHEPRYPTLRGIMGAKKKPFQTWSAADLGLDADELQPVQTTLSVSIPPQRQAGRIVEGETVEAKARELARLLREEAKVI